VLLLLSVFLFVGVRYGPQLLSKIKVLTAGKINQTVIPKVPAVKKEVVQKEPSPDELASQQEKINAEKMAALTFAEEGDLEKSVDAYKDLVSEIDNDPEIYNNLGVVFKRLGREKDARIAYQKAIDLKSDYPEALNNLAVIDIENLNYEAAKEKLLESVSLDENYAEPHFHLAALYEKEEKLDEAVSHYTSFLKNSDKLDPDLKRKIDLRLDILKARLNREGDR